MYYTLEIQKLLNRAELLEDTDKAKIKYYLDAIQIADANDDISFAYDLRGKLIDIEWNHSNRPNFVPTFSWLLDAYDAQPSQYEADDLLWRYKWVISELNANPDFSRAQIDTVLEDFKRRSLEEGFNLRAYYSKLLHEACDQMDAEKSREYQNLLEKYEKDYISDCEACEIDSDVLVSLIEGNFDQGLSKATPILEKVHTCAKVPFITRINLAYYAFKAGNIDLAKKFIQETEDELLTREDDQYLVNYIGFFFATIFQLDETKAWHHFEKLVKFTKDTDPSTLFFFSTGMLEGLRNSDWNKTVALTIDEEIDWYKPNGQYQIKEILDYYRAKAIELAERFDKRNNNNNFSKQVMI